MTVIAPAGPPPGPPPRSRARRRVLLLCSAVVAVLTVGAVVALVVTFVVADRDGAATTTSMWDDSDSAQEVAADTEAVELGVAVEPLVDGTAEALRFYQADGSTTGHTGRLWTADGELLASVTFPDTSSTGWKEAPLADPVPLSAGQTYVVSYHAPEGRYGVTSRYFAHRDQTSGGLRAPRSTVERPNGLFSYGPPGSFPTETFVGSNYWVDLVFAPAGPVPEVPADAAPVPPPPPSPGPADAPPAVADDSPLALTEPDGGRAYFGRWDAALPSGPEFFPIGVWFESVVSQSDVDTDVAAGINTYVALTADSDVSLIEDNGLHAIPQYEEWVNQLGPDNESGINGWTLYDEVDMVEGPGTGFDTLAAITAGLPRDDGRLRYNNYGKGVLFWQSDDDAARFVNDYQDVVSADAYWFTDPNICGPSEGGALLSGGEPLTTESCRLAANYGTTIDRVRDLDGRDGRRVPVWAFIEVGHPFSEEDAPTIRPAEVRAAVWSSIVHGARGVIYFNHSFGGECFSYHALREPCYADVRSAVTETNAQITRLAPVLNSWTVDGFVTVEGAVDTLVKYQDGTFWVFATSRSPDPQSAVFRLSCVDDASVVVDGEDRTTTLSDGRFSDDFADGNAVHVYRIDAGSDAAASCGIG